MFIVSKRGCTVSRPGRHIQIVTLQTWAQSLKKHTHTTHNPIFFFLKKTSHLKRMYKFIALKKRMYSLSPKSTEIQIVTLHT